MVEYNFAIELLRDVITHGITCLEVELESHLVVSHLNGVYHMSHPSLLRHFLRFRLLEIHFEHISYNHIPRNQNKIVDAYAN